MAAFSHIFFSRKRCLGPIDTDNTPTRELCHALTKCTGGTMQSSVGVLCFLDRGMLREYIHIFASYFHAILWFCVLEHIAQPCAVTKNARRRDTIHTNQQMQTWILTIYQNSHSHHFTPYFAEYNPCDIL